MILGPKEDAAFCGTLEALVLESWVCYPFTAPAIKLSWMRRLRKM